MLLLAIDTSTSAITVAVHDGVRVLATRTTVDPRAHTERLAPNIAEALRLAGRRPAEVTLVVAGAGPGPFTGLRVGLVSAAAFALAVQAPTAGVCSLDALAAQAMAEQPRECAGGLVVATDARRKEVYWARYDAAPQAPAGLRRVVGPLVCAPAVVADALDVPSVGRGALGRPDVFGPHLGLLDVDAGALADLAVARLAAGVELDPARPRYLRRPDAQPAAARKPALPDARASRGPR